MEVLSVSEIYSFAHRRESRANSVEHQECYIFGSKFRFVCQRCSRYISLLMVRTRVLGIADRYMLVL